MSDDTEHDVNDEIKQQEQQTKEQEETPTEEEDGDAEIEAMKKRVKELEEVARQLSTTGKPAAEVNNGPDVDSRSVYVGSVDYSTTPEELQEFFSACGTVNRVTILCDKFTGHPKGFAYVEFKDQDAVVNAVILNESEFKGRQLKITPKRTNIHGFAPGRGGRGGRGGGRGAPRGRGGFGGYAAPYGGYPPPAYGGYGGYEAPYGGGYAPAPRGRFHNKRGSFAPY